jgi:hypothetical protein
VATSGEDSQTQNTARAVLNCRVCEIDMAFSYEL